MKRIALSLILVVLFAGPMMAAVDEHAEAPTLNADYWQLQLVKLVNFLVIALAAYFILRKPIAEFFQKRADQIESDLNSAQIAREEAEKRLAEVEEQVENINVRVDEIMDRARQEAQAEHDRIIDQAKKESEKIKEMTENEIATRLKAARLDLKRYASGLAVEQAREMLRRELNEEKDRRMIERSIEEIGGVH